MSHKYIRLTETHKSKTFIKGDVLKVPESSFEAWEKSGIIEEVEESDYNEFLNKNAQEKAQFVDGLEYKLRDLKSIKSWDNMHAFILENQLDITVNQEDKLKDVKAMATDLLKQKLE